MRYGFTALACAALAATSLAHPVIDLRGRDVTICTVYTTIVTTSTLSPSMAGVGAAVQTPPAPEYEYYSSRKHNRPSRSSSSPDVAPTASSSTIEPTTPPVPTPTPEPSSTSTSTSVPVVTTPSAPPPVPTPSPSPAPSPAPASSFATEILNSHNSKRALHGSPALVWDDTMASYAQSITDKCIFEHSGGPYGENLAAGYSDGTAVVEAWYAEGSMYDYSAGQFSEATGHFTQVVWKSATKCGCAETTCNTKTTPGKMVVCEYDTGNVIGFFTQNVFPLLS